MPEIYVTDNVPPVQQNVSKYLYLNVSKNVNQLNDIKHEIIEDEMNASKQFIQDLQEKKI